VIVARKSLPAADLKGMITWLKANPEKATSGTAGAGSPQHVIGTFFQSVTGTRFQFAAYRSGAQAMQDLLAERIDIMIDSQTISLPQVCDGRIKAFAVTSMTRSAVAPDIPTVDEAGLPGFHFSVWNATWAPKGTPRNIVGKLNTAVVEALADAQVRAPHGSGPGNFPARATDPGSALRFAEGRDREMVAHYQSRGDQD
jgi:tripartite-type tricarboxylate transporter receptor subunit TctC